MNASVPSLLARRCIAVTGKGGVGKTTATAALALAAARMGKRTCAVELSGSSRLAQLFGLAERSFTPRSVAPNLDTFSLTAWECFEDFGRRKLRLGPLARPLFDNRLTHAFVDAVPGLHDIVQLGKIENLLNEPHRSEPRYDLLILDAPATGHGLTLLDAPRTLVEMSRAGPFHDLAEIIDTFLSDPVQFAVALVTLPAPLPINETLELAARLPERQRRLLGGCVLNKVHDPFWPEGVSWPMAHSTLTAAEHPTLREWAAIGETEWRLQQVQAEAFERLKALETPLHPLNWQRTRDLERHHLEGLADQLAAQFRVS